VPSPARHPDYPRRPAARPFTGACRRCPGVVRSERAERRSFPSDHFSVDDASHNTGIRVSLPKPNCATRPSDCADIDVINTLDGSTRSRGSPFPSAARFDVSTVSSATVSSSVWGIPSAGPAPGKSSASIRSCGIRRRTRCTPSPTHSWISTRGTRSSSPTGSAISPARPSKPAPRQLPSRPELRSDEGREAEGLSQVPPRRARRVGGAAGWRRGRSVFTPRASPPSSRRSQPDQGGDAGSASFLLGNNGTIQTVFPLSSVTSIVWNQQRSTVGALTAGYGRRLRGAASLSGRGFARLRQVRVSRLRDGGKFIRPLAHAPACPRCNSRTTSTSTCSCRPARRRDGGSRRMRDLGHGFERQQNNSCSWSLEPWPTTRHRLDRRSTPACRPAGTG